MPQENDATTRDRAQDQGPQHVIADFVTWIIRGYLSPRASARAVLDRQPGVDSIVLMLVLAYLIVAIFEIVIPGTRIETEMGFVGHHLSQLMQSALSFLMIAAMVTGVGRAMGGTGSFIQSCVVVSWHTLVTSFLTPIFMLVYQEFSAATLAAPEGGELEIAGGILFAGTFASLTWTWLLASYVTELHGFRKVVNVLGVMLGLLFTMGIMLTSVVGAG